MFYKQFDFGGRLVSIGTTSDDVVLQENFVQISQSEYESLLRVLSMDLDSPKLTPLNDNHELILN